MSRLHSITPPGLLVGGATDPMKGECECIGLADAKQAFVEAQKVGRTADAAIAGQIVSNLNTGRTFAFAADQEKAILALTPAQVADAFRKHIDPNRLVVIRAGDFHRSRG